MHQVKSGTDWLKMVAKRMGSGEALPISQERSASIEVERWLQTHGVDYAPPGPIPMDLIDERRSRTNQARRDPIVADSVERFATAMKNGTIFPPIVVFAASSKVVIIDGNNRQAAAKKCGLGEISGIVVAEDTPSELIQLLTVESNAHHGVTPDLSWRLQQAFSLCSIGFSDVQAAEASGVSVTQIRVARQVQDAEQRARSLKIGGFFELPASTKQALSVLRDEAVFQQAAKVTVNTVMTTEQVREMLRSLKGLTSEGARLEFIASVAKERGIEAATRKAIGGGRTIARLSSPKSNLVSGIGLVLKCDEQALARHVVTRHDLDLLLDRVKALGQKVLSLQLALQKVKVEEEDKE